jgi:hypothetical protein
MTGKVVFSALATALLSIWQGVSIRTSQHPIISKCPPHMYLSDTKLLIGDDKKA